MGYFVAFSDVALFVIGIYCFGYAARKSSLLYVLLLGTVIGLILIFPLLLYFDKLTIQQIFQTPQAHNWYWLSAASVFGFVGGNYFSLLNLRTAGEKINSLLAPAITALTIGLGYLVFEEQLQLHQWFGIMVTLGVIVWFLIKNGQQSSTAYNTIGFVSGALTIICLSLSIVCSIKGATNSVTFFQAIWMKLLVALFVIFIAFIGHAKNIKRPKLNSKFYFIILTGVVCQTILADYLWYYASFEIGINIFQVILATLPLWLYAVDVYVLKKSKPSVLFLSVAVIAGMGILLVMI